MVMLASESVTEINGVTDERPNVYNLTSREEGPFWGLIEKENLGGSVNRGPSSLFLSHDMAKAYPRARPTGTATALPIWRYLHVQHF